MARRYVNPNRFPAPGSPAFAAAYASLSEAEQQQVIDGFRDALHEIRDAVGGRPDDRGEMPAWLRDDSDGESPSGPCQTCNGSGRLRHPVTGKPGVKCPGCDGTGEAPAPDDGEGSAENRYNGRYSKVIRFQHGGVQVFNSARQAGLDAAWARLEATAREIESNRKGQGR